MSDRHDTDMELTPAQRNARDAVRGLSRPAADPEFRRRLKADFTAGALRPQDRPAAGGGNVLRLFGPVLAAAAMIAVAVLGLSTHAGPELAGLHGEGRVLIDGVVMADAGMLSSRLRPGARLELEGDVSVDLLYPDAFLWRLAPGTVFTLPEPPGRWLNRRLHAYVETGEASVRTGAAFAGNTLVVGTDEGDAVVTGTMVDVFRNGDVTCICLLDGHCRVVADGRDLGALEPGTRWVLPRDGGEPQRLDIAGPHRDQMLGLDHDHTLPRR
ncbi:MAG TPA: hypothetical protein P5571_10520 [Candidatus Krumholzibacteria bacterium]|nr:hypothetical protein [Candidatus Krumholzibacteria bacterium]